MARSQLSAPRRGHGAQKRKQPGAPKRRQQQKARRPEQFRGGPWGWEFAERLRALMGARGVRAWADDVGVSSSLISSYLSGGRQPNTTSLRRIAEHTGVSLDWLLFGEGGADVVRRGQWRTDTALEHDLAERLRQLANIAPAGSSEGDADTASDGASSEDIARFILQAGRRPRPFAPGYGAQIDAAAVIAHAVEQVHAEKRAWDEWARRYNDSSVAGPYLTEAWVIAVDSIDRIDPADSPSATSQWVMALGPDVAEHCARSVEEAFWMVPDGPRRPGFLQLTELPLTNLTGEARDSSRPSRVVEGMLCEVVPLLQPPSIADRDAVFRNTLAGVGEFLLGMKPGGAWLWRKLEACALARWRLDQSMTDGALRG